MSKENFAQEKALMAKQAQNTRSWANMMNEDNAKALPMGPSSAPATYKAKTYLPGASKWAADQATIAEEASAERANTVSPLRNSNIEDLEKNKRSYDRYTDRMGLPRRASRTPSRERRRRNSEKRRTARRSHSRRRSYSRRRSPSPRRRSRSPGRRYGVGRRYVAAPGFGTRRRSPSPRHGRSHRSPSPRRRSPSPRRRGVSPLRYTVAQNGRTVNEFGRNVPDRRQTQRQAPRFNGTRGQRRPYKPANWNV